MKKFSNIKFEHDKRLLSGINTTAMNFDFVAISKITNKPIIFEWLKRGPEQKDYITPHSSCPTRYVHMNKGKFAGYQTAKQVLGAEVYYVNYAPEDNKIMSHMVKVMKHTSLSFRNNQKNQANEIFPNSIIGNKPIEIGIEEVARFNSIDSFSEWMTNFLEYNCYEVLNEDRTMNNMTKEEATNYIKSCEKEYETQQNKARSGIAFHKYLVMPDLSGDMFEARLSADIEKYKFQIDKHYFNKSNNRYVFLNQIHVDVDPNDLSLEECHEKIKDIYSLSFAFDETHVFVFVLFNLDLDNVAYVEIKNNQLSVIDLTHSEYREVMQNILMHIE